jgi:hypothetical protein
MRDSRDAKVRWLWERMLVSTRPDPSDAGMTWFLVTGDEIEVEVEGNGGRLDYVQLNHATP